MARSYDDDDRVVIERRSGSTLLALLAGMAIGAGMALLFAPQSGDEARQILRRKARRVRRVASEYANDLRDRTTDLRDRASHLVDEATARGRELVDDVRDS
jgi:gas vesicle protein